MEVGTGLKPKMPGTLQTRLPVEESGVRGYVKYLLSYLEVTHREVFEMQRRSIMKGRDKGRSAVLKRGDLAPVWERGEGREPRGSQKLPRAAGDPRPGIPQTTLWYTLV